jgi:tRNA (cmo5U34)-methyltransferase
MSSHSIAAYDIPERVASYDADMDLMHPNRHKMLQIVLELLPFSAEASFTALDLGVGTGFFSQAILRKFQNSRVIALDGAASMIEMAKGRLGQMADRVDFRIGDFRNLSEVLRGERGDLVYSAYALHHLTAPEKAGVIGEVLKFLKPGGWFLNADLIIGHDAQIESRIQDIRVHGIVDRARRNGSSNNKDERFVSAASTRAFIDNLQSREHDQPLTLNEDLQILREAGFENASVFWLEYREAVTGGFKSA